MILFRPPRDRLRGILLGTAIGDALGLPFEGMSAKAIARRRPSFVRFSLLGSTGFVSDDTEQSALVAQSLIVGASPRHPQGRSPRLGEPSLARGGATDRAAVVREMRGALRGWFLRLPWGIGFGTLRGCARLMLGLSRSGVRSAGNGAAMRAAICGGYLAGRSREERVAMIDALSEITHTDPRAVQGARFVAELAAIYVQSAPNETDPRGALPVVTDPELRTALDLALHLASVTASIDDASSAIGNTGFVLHSVPLALFCVMRFPSPIEAITAAIRAGGDTDTNAAITGALMGALHGETGLPQHLLTSLARGPFGPKHLRALADDLTSDPPRATATYSWPLALARNLALYPVVLLHAVKVLASRLD